MGQSERFREIGRLAWTEWEREILDFWKKENIFQKTLEQRQSSPRFVFYEGPPSANGKPGIHHVLSRTLKDLVCRFFTMQGYYVLRKGGWDTHGLPVELEVEKKLGIRKKDIGKVISVEEFNRLCKQEVFRYKEAWEALTVRMGFWLDLENAYITCAPEYIESLWWALKELFKRGLLYRDYTILPYSPAAGTPLSHHELNLPGCYREVADLSPTVLFHDAADSNLYYLAWTTTPWTLLSNVALAVHPDATYVEVATVHPYTHEPIRVILAEERLSAYFDPAMEGVPEDQYEGDPYHLPYRVVKRFAGRDLEGRSYHPLFSFKVVRTGHAYQIVLADFVTMDEGTGIVHIAPAHGAEDFALSKQYQLPMILLVDQEGRFTEEVEPWKGRPVKNFYDSEEKDVNEEIVEYLFAQKKLFRVETYRHNYPHCWRTDKPVIYYPFRSWFIRVSAFREELLRQNEEIRWQPPEIGRFRFGNWLAVAQDWNLSRARYWGTPLPIWATEDESEVVCIGSFAELRQEVEKAVRAGFMRHTLPEDFDPHRPYVDEIVLCSPSGKPMYRYPEVIDVWFDSGAMPFAQWHYPMENTERFQEQFPADFIAEGVDQTRGWFYTLHVLGVLLFGKPAFRSVIVNGLVLDKHGNKMSKRLGNVVDPMAVMERYGADAVRWYMVSTNPPWENLRFDEQQIGELLKRHFRALANTYHFFAMYANIDGFRGREEAVPVDERPLIDRWLLARLAVLIESVEQAYRAYEPTRVARLLQDFIMEDLSNWYVRLNRRRFWKAEYNQDKVSAYQTLMEALVVTVRLMAPIAPFFSEWIYRNIWVVVGEGPPSVHMTDFPRAPQEWKDADLVRQMEIIQDIVHVALALRKKAQIKVRQPLRQLVVFSTREEVHRAVQALGALIQQEVNVKEVRLVREPGKWMRRTLRLNYARVGPRLGKLVRAVEEVIRRWESTQIEQFLQEGQATLTINGTAITLTRNDVEVVHEKVEGWLSETSSTGAFTVALDTEVTDALRYEGMARELINRIQQVRKQKGLSVTARIRLWLVAGSWLEPVIARHGSLIQRETLAQELKFLVDEAPGALPVESVSVQVYGKPVHVGVEPIAADAEFKA